MNKTEAEKLTWQQAKQNLKENIKGFPELVDSCLDSAYLHGFEEAKKAIAEQKAKIVEEIKKLRAKNATVNPKLQHNVTINKVLEIINKE